MARFVAPYLSMATCLQKHIDYYTKQFGMKLLRSRDIPEDKYSNAFLVGWGPWAAPSLGHRMGHR